MKIQGFLSDSHLKCQKETMTAQPSKFGLDVHWSNILYGFCGYAHCLLLFNPTKVILVIEGEMRNQSRCVMGIYNTAMKRNSTSWQVILIGFRPLRYHIPMIIR